MDLNREITNPDKWARAQQLAGDPAYYAEERGDCSLEEIIDALYLDLGGQFAGPLRPLHEAEEEMVH